MVLRKARSILVYFVVFLITFILCISIGQIGANAQQVNLTVSAAISLKEALEEIKPVYLSSSPNKQITYNFGSSGSLQQQIEQGAPVDIFISAAARQMNALEEKNLLMADTRKNLLTNELVLVVPQDDTTINKIEDLTGDRITKIAIGEPKSVPAGQYAEETLKFFNILDAVKSKIVYAKDVRQVLSYVETGNVNAGFVYLSDSKTSDAVRVAATAPADAHSPIIYPIAVVKSSQNPEAAKEFVEFLSSNSAKTIFTKYGFGVKQ